MKLLVIALLGACVSALAQAQAKQVLTVQELVALTQYHELGADKKPVLRGMKISKRIPIGWADNFSHRYIRTIVDDVGIAHHQVLLEMQYMGGWRFYRAATLNGQTLPFNTEERRFTRCTREYLECGQQEIVSAELSRQQLERASQTGLVVNFEAKKPGGNIDAVFPAAYVKAYLIKLNGGKLPPSLEPSEKVLKPQSLVIAVN